MKVLVGCEFSQVVTKAFRDAGHIAYSCDFEEPEINKDWHIYGDVMNVIDDGWDMAIFHPPCTHLAASGARWFKYKKEEQSQALEFVRKLLYCSIPKIALENPVSVISTKIRRPDQIIQPWQYGHGETKATCLWLKNLPLLKPTQIVNAREARVHKCPPSKDRWKIRSRTYKGIAKAMAEQWGF